MKVMNEERTDEEDRVKMREEEEKRKGRRKEIMEEKEETQRVMGKSNSKAVTNSLSPLKYVCIL